MVVFCGISDVKLLIALMETFSGINKINGLAPKETPQEDSRDVVEFLLSFHLMELV